MKNSVPHVSAASPHGSKKWFKKLKARAERRKAKHDPKCQPSYGKYKGYD